MMNKRKCRKLIQEQKPMVKEFQDILEKYKEVPNDSKGAITHLIAFMEDVSKFQDKGYFSNGHQFKMEKYFPEYYETANSLNRHLENAGREKYGWNRTTKGEKVTLDNVYLGNIEGLFTLPARKWLDSDSVYTIAAFQARPFVKSHCEAIKKTYILLNAR